MNTTEPTVLVEADAIYESVRAMCHANGVQPAPVVYGVLGNLKGATGSMLAQTLTQMALGLERSLAEYDVTEDDGRDPAASASTAAGHMRAAAALAEQIGLHLTEAQNAIAGQGYRTTIPSPATPL